jgi:hypothetical protein
MKLIEYADINKASKKLKDNMILLNEELDEKK